MLLEHGPSFAAEALVNFVLPYIIYSVEVSRIGEIDALIASSCPPVVWSVVAFARRRRVDAMSLLVLGGIVLSLLALIGGGSPRLLLLREKLVTGVIGLVFLISALIRRPLIYELARAGSLRRAPEEAARMERLRDEPMFRTSMNVMTIVWGIGLLVDVAFSAVLAFTISIKQYLVINPIAGYAVVGGLSVWTYWYSQRRRRIGEAVRSQREQLPPSTLTSPDQTPHLPPNNQGQAQPEDR